MKKKIRNFFILLFTLAFAAIEPMSAYAAEDVLAEDTKVRVSLLGKYDSADTASVKQINTYSKTIQFRNHDVGKNYTLSYDNTSMIYDIHGKPMSASLLEVGQVVNITFLKGVKHLNSLIISSEAWVEENVNDFELVRGDETAKINGTVLHITPRTLIVSEGQAVNPEDILPTDTLRVSGIDKEIYSIVVTRGHGYVSLSSDTVEDRSLVGAWIELDKEVIRKITPNMLISAPEGSYNVSINGNGAKFSSEIIVNRNEETVIDTSVAEVEKIKEGNVTFIVTPSFARVFVDGDEVLTEVPHTYTYGKHKLHVMADGYEPQDHILKVAERDATLFIDLVAKKDSSSSSDDQSVSSGDASAEGSSDDYWADTASTVASSEPDLFVSDGNASNTASSKNSKSSAFKTSSTSDSSSSKTASVDPDAAATKSKTSDGNSASSGSSKGKDSDGSSTSDDSDKPDENKNVVTGYKVTFDAPIGVEAYFDDNYVGITPVSFTKTAGQHMVTLKKDGYETKSYTIQIDKEKTNVTYSFPALVQIKKDDETPSGDDDKSKDDDDTRKDDDDSGKDGSDDGSSKDGGDDSGDGRSDAKPEEVSGGEP